MCMHKCTQNGIAQQDDFDLRFFTDVQQHSNASLSLFLSPSNSATFVLFSSWNSNNGNWLLFKLFGVSWVEMQFVECVFLFSLSLRLSVGLTSCSVFDDCNVELLLLQFSFGYLTRLFFVAAAEFATVSSTFDTQMQWAKQSFVLLVIKLLPAFFEWE